MNLNDIKGIIEIDGMKFNPKDIIRALIDQGLKIHSVNGTLLIGRSFIEQSPGLEIESNSCPIFSHCKIYDKLRNNASSSNNLSEATSDINMAFESLNNFPSNFQPSSNKAYVDRVQINNDDMDIMDLFTQSPSQPSSYRPLSFNEHNPNNDLDIDEFGDYSSDSMEMMGVSPLTKYGPSKIDVSSIPAKHRGKCPYCGTTININWKFCGSCGNIM